MNQKMGAGIAIGIGVGVALGVAIGNVGAGIAIEDTVKNAIKKLTERADRIDANKNKILTTLNNLQDQAIKLSSQIEEKYQALQEAQMQSQSVNGNLI